MMLVTHVRICQSTSVNLTNQVVLCILFSKLEHDELAEDHAKREKIFDVEG